MVNEIYQLKDGRKDGRMEGWKDGRMERWKDGRIWEVVAVAKNGSSDILSYSQGCKFFFFFIYPST
jgi:hypothetical protein